MSPTEAMVQEILERSAHAGRDKLGHLAYQMARTCLSKAEKTAVNHRWLEAPRDVADLGTDLRHIETRSGIVFDRLALPLANPSRGSAIAAAWTCLRVASSIEGETARVLFLRALVSQAEGDTEEVEQTLDRMLSVPVTRSWASCAQELRQTVCLGKGSFEEVIDLGELTERRSEGRLDTLFNMATAYAWLRDGRNFKVCCERFRRSDESLGDSARWSWLVEAEAAWFADQLGQDPDSIRMALARPASEGGA